jgi:hypothetical protein
MVINGDFTVMELPLVIKHGLLEKPPVSWMISSKWAHKLYRKGPLLQL